MTVLIAYMSVEGQTRKIAETIAEDIEGRGERAALLNIASDQDFALIRPNAAILCAPVHSGHYPQPFFDFVRQEKDWLNSVPSAFISVSLSIISDDPEERAEAMGYADTLIAETGWAPGLVHHAAGALRFTEYDFFKRWMVRRVVAREKRPEDAARDYEFTNWGALNSFVDDFLDGARH